MLRIEGAKAMQVAAYEVATEQEQFLIPYLIWKLDPAEVVKEAGNGTV